MKSSTIASIVPISPLPSFSINACLQLALEGEVGDICLDGSVWVVVKVGEGDLVVQAENIAGRRVGEDAKNSAANRVQVLCRCCDEATVLDERAVGEEPAKGNFAAINDYGAGCVGASDVVAQGEGEVLRFLTGHESWGRKSGGEESGNGSDGALHFESWWFWLVCFGEKR